ncbi:hypothetical protein DPEC_G00172910 [Dallia pectoralis]|uniref:Uncharacterized protein n=1 Tax=Dallia pectoralis TaxID=75939 RepID=A0ACC2GDV4_DALPE|nr:hypothetical protein DPEC_G00172910 [Dallia pectoralis]
MSPFTYAHLSSCECAPLIQAALPFCVDVTAITRQRLRWGFLISGHRFACLRDQTKPLSPRTDCATATRSKLPGRIPQIKSASGVTLVGLIKPLGKWKGALR